MPVVGIWGLRQQRVSHGHEGITAAASGSWAAAAASVRSSLFFFIQIPEQHSCADAELFVRQSFVCPKELLNVHLGEGYFYVDG